MSEKKRCFLFHRWGPWVTVVKKTVIPDWGWRHHLAMFARADEVTKTRACERCEEKQERWAA